MSEKNGSEAPKKGGSKKGIKSSKKLDIDEVVMLTIDPENLPPKAKFHSFENFYHQELIIKKKVICFKRARYILEDERSILAPLPPEIEGHFGNGVKTFIVQQSQVCNVSENKIKSSLSDMGIDISEGKVHEILMESTKKLESEYNNIAEEGFKSEQLKTDDTGARFEKKNWFTTVIQNEFFAYFKTTPTKSRKNFLLILQQSKTQYALNKFAYDYLRSTIKSSKQENIISKLEKHDGKTFETLNDWEKFLDSIKINKLTTGKQILRYLEEAALLGGVANSGVNLEAVLTSDNARQFKKIFGVHALCWVHMIRSISKIIPGNKEEIEELDRILDQVWTFYKNLKDYQETPDNQKISELEKKFDEIFGQSVQSQKLLEALNSFKEYKKELLCILKYPKTPLHNNSSESDIRPAVIKRKISGPTRSVWGRLARDIWLTIVKTCRKLGISPWVYIADRLSHNPQMMSLSEIIHQRVIAQQLPP